MDFSRVKDTATEHSVEHKSPNSSSLDSNPTKYINNEFGRKLLLKPQIETVLSNTSVSEPDNSDNFDSDYSSYILSSDQTIKKSSIQATSPCFNFSETSSIMPSKNEETSANLNEEFKNKKISISRRPINSLNLQSKQENQPISITKTNTTHENKTEIISNQVTKETNLQIPISKQILKPSGLCTPYTTKYAPSSLENIIGNTSQAKMLQNWLKRYADDPEHNWTKETKKKVALVSGPPGTGKTTAARIVSSSLDLRIIELNASDCRNKSFIQDKIAPFVCNTSIIDTKKVGKAVLIMDEVDGMTTGDEGGIAALIECIQITKVPIICICNDRFATGIKSLVNYCLEIKFVKPRDTDCVKVLERVNSEENLGLSEKQILSIIGYSKGDLRFALNMLEFCRNEYCETSAKDAIAGLSAFETVCTLISPGKSWKIDLDEKVSMLLADYDFISMLLVENYADVVEFGELVEASEAFVISDVIMNKIKKEQEWTLLPDFAFLCLLPAGLSKVEGHWPRFPQRTSKPKKSVPKKKGKKKIEIDLPLEKTEAEIIEELLNKLI